MALSLLSATSCLLVPADLTDAVSGIADPFIGLDTASMTLVGASEVGFTAARTSSNFSLASGNVLLVRACCRSF